MTLPNESRYRQYTDGEILYGPATPAVGTDPGYNLSDLQGRIGDDIDTAALHVLGSRTIVKGLKVTLRPGLTVHISPGTVYLDGQRITVTPGLNLGGLAPNAANNIYVEAIGTPYDDTLVGFPGHIASTVGVLSASQVLLAIAYTDGSVVTLIDSNVVVRWEQELGWTQIDDNLGPAAFARSLYYRFGQIANRLKAIMGETSWLTGPVTNILTLWERFNVPFGHNHSGVVFEGPKLTQANTHQSPDTDTGWPALHHTIGPGESQAAPGNHVHTAAVVTSVGPMGASNVQQALNLLASTSSGTGHTHAAADIVAGILDPHREGSNVGSGGYLRDDGQFVVPAPPRGLRLYGCYVSDAHHITLKRSLLRTGTLGMEIEISGTVYAKNDADIVLSLTGVLDIPIGAALTGTVTTNGGPVVFGNSTAFLTQLRVGETVVISPSSSPIRLTVRSIQSNTQFTAFQLTNSTGSFRPWQRGGVRVPSSLYFVYVRPGIPFTAYLDTAMPVSGYHPRDTGHRWAGAQFWNDQGNVLDTSWVWSQGTQYARAKGSGTGNYPAFSGVLDTDHLSRHLFIPEDGMIETFVELAAQAGSGPVVVTLTMDGGLFQNLIQTPGLAACNRHRGAHVSPGLRLFELVASETGGFGSEVLNLTDADDGASSSLTSVHLGYLIRGG